MNIKAIGGRKFCAFVVATIAVSVLCAFGIELSESTLSTIVSMYLAFAAGNGLEHLASKLGSRRAKPPIAELPGDVVDAVSDALDLEDDP